MKFRKKPVVIEAMQCEDTATCASAIIRWAHAGRPPISDAIILHDGFQMRVRTLEGEMIASLGDWIIKGIKGEFYPCKPDIFAAIYEPVQEAP